MALNLLVWLYITWICLAWGNIFFRLIIRKQNQNIEAVYPSPWIICFSGLAVIGLLSFWLSLFLPAGWFMHGILLTPALIFQLLNRQRIIAQVKEFRQGYSLLTAILGAGALIILLLISSHYIIHPDTLSYHTKTIQWIEHYKAVPGLVHLDNELGLQSWWFTAMAVFRFDFIKANNFLFLNGCVAAWFVFFCISQLKSSTSWAWLALLAFSFLSWTQVRLTAASASPDFIVAIFVWGAFYFFLSASPDNKTCHYLPAVLFSGAAFALKLSGIVVLLLPAFIYFQLIRKKQFGPAIGVIAIVFFAISPFIIHNVIATGYPLYPTLIADAYTVDWKASPQTVLQFQEYIAAYARTPVAGFDEARQSLTIPFDQWIPAWWSALQLIDKLLLAFAGILFLANCFSIKNQSKRTLPGWIMLIISLAGTVLWFLKAPNPRFGICFIIPMIYILGKGVTDFIRLRANRIFFNGIVLLLIGCTWAYIGYRLLNFFEAQQIISPLGVKSSVYRSVNCGGFNIYKSEIPESGFIPFPSTQNDCNEYILRGNELSSGFRKR